MRRFLFGRFPVLQIQFPMKSSLVSEKDFRVFIPLVIEESVLCQNSSLDILHSRMRFLFLFLFFFQPVFGMQWAFRDPALGVQTLTYFDQVRERPVVVEFWYPAERKGLRERPESDSLMVHPEEFRGAPMKKGKGKCPLILISHGHRGDRRDLSWLAERLVSQGGFLVAAVDHFGDQRKHFDMQKSIRFWDRALDFTFLLNQLEKEESFLDKIDFDKVGFVGYSLGGMTGLGLAGAQAENLKEILPLLQNELSDFPNHVLERFDFAESERSFLEPRIRGAFLICPATFPYTSEALKKVSIP